MFRKTLTLIFLSSLVIVCGVPRMAGASGNTPLTGNWNFCISESQIGCIETLTIQDSVGAEKRYASRGELAIDGFGLNVVCNVIGIAIPGVNQPMVEGKPCAVPDSSTCAMSDGGSVNLMISLSSSGQIGDGRNYALKLRTGDLNISFSIGHGGLLSNAVTTIGPDGNHSFALRGAIQTVYDDSFGSTAVQRTALVNAYDVHFLRTYRPGSPVCIEIPMNGGFIDANAFRVSLAFDVAPLDSARIVSLKSTVTGVHFLPGYEGDETKLVPARFRLFVPTQFLNWIGYQAGNDFSLTGISLSTADGQSTSPSMSNSEGGVMIDSGISHYSSPNPTVKFFRPGKTAADDVPMIRVGKSMTRMAIIMELGIVPKNGDNFVSSVPRKFAKYCSVKVTKIRGLRAGNCQVKFKIGSKANGYKSWILNLKVVK